MPSSPSGSPMGAPKQSEQKTLRRSATAPMALMLRHGPAHRWVTLSGLQVHVRGPADTC